MPICNLLNLFNANTIRNQLFKLSSSFKRDKRNSFNGIPQHSGKKLASWILSGGNRRLFQSKFNWRTKTAHYMTFGMLAMHHLPPFKLAY